MGSTASVIAEIVPDVKERLPDLPAPRQIDDPESVRFRLFDSISTFLKAASATQPIVLMLEDLHWSDKPSLKLLEFVARELANSHIMIVGNYRDMELNRRHPLSITLGELSRERLFDRVLLRGLQKHDVRRFIEVAAGIDPPDSLVDVVHTQTEGNPFFVTETVRLLIQEGDITAGAGLEGGTSSWEVRIPEGVREVIGRRLDRLSERCNEVLTIAAVVGRQFRFGVLMNLIDDASENMLLDVLDEALEARIIEEVTSEIGLYQFSHALMQETLTSELSANRTVRHHARIATALEEFYGSDAVDHAAELVEHFAEAEVMLGSEKLVHYSMGAAEAAATAIAWEEVLAHYRRVVQAESPPADARMLADANFGITKASVFLDRQDEAADALTAAFDGLEELKDRDGVVNISTHRFTAITIRLNEALGPILRATLQYVDPDGNQAGEIHAGLGYALVDLPGRLSEGEQHFVEALNIARTTGDVELKARALGYGLTSETRNSRYESALEKCDELIQLQPELSDKTSVWRGYGMGGFLYSFAGETDLAIESDEAALRIANEMGDKRVTVIALQSLVVVAAYTGDWAAVDSYIAQASSSADYFATFMEGWLAWTNFERGDFDEGEEAVRRISGSQDSVQVGALFRSLCHAGRVTGNPHYLEEAKSTAETGELHYGVAINQKTLVLAEVGVELNDIQLVESVYDDLNSLPTPIFGSTRGEVFTTQARAAWAIGDTAKSVADFESDLATSHESGYGVELVWTQFFYAKMLLERDAAGDRERATDLQDEAIAIATELGLKPLLERLLGQRERLKA
jgi:tetratricopeptide (TPR) repeat protein